MPAASRDSGLAAHLMRLSEAELTTRSPVALAEFGHLLETFAANEPRGGNTPLLPDVAAHLDRTIITGNWCRYRAEPTLTWRIEAPGIRDGLT